MRNYINTNAQRWKDRREQTIRAQLQAESPVFFPIVLENLIIEMEKE